MKTNNRSIHLTNQLDDTGGSKNVALSVSSQVVLVSGNLVAIFLSGLSLG